MRSRAFSILRTLAVARCFVVRGVAPRATAAPRGARGAAASRNTATHDDGIVIDGDHFSRVSVEIIEGLLTLDIFEADAAAQDALVERACAPPPPRAADDDDAAAPATAAGGGGADPYGAVLWPAALAVARRCAAASTDGVLIGTG